MLILISNQEKNILRICKGKFTWMLSFMLNEDKGRIYDVEVFWSKIVWIKRQKLTQLLMSIMGKHKEMTVNDRYDELHLCWIFVLKAIQCVEMKIERWTNFHYYMTSVRADIKQSIDCSMLIWMHWWKEKFSQDEWSEKFYFKIDVNEI